MMATETVVKNSAPINQRQKLVDNSMDVGGEMVLKEGVKYMRHMPSGRIYPFQAGGAKLDNVELFIYHKNGDQKVNKPVKKKPAGPFTRQAPQDTFEGGQDRVLDA
jgi:hypothetical protein